MKRKEDERDGMMREGGRELGKRKMREGERDGRARESPLARDPSTPEAE